MRVLMDGTDFTKILQLVILQLKLARAMFQRAKMSERRS
jgi:hypothetical protein